MRQGHDSLVGKKKTQKTKLQGRFGKHDGGRLHSHPNRHSAAAPWARAPHPSSLRAGSFGVTAGGETIPCHVRLFLR